MPRGSEGRGDVTKVCVRMTSKPEGHRTMLGVFESVEDATAAISEIIGAGIVPAALEMMDQGILVAVEAAFQFGFPLDAQAILLMEVDGLEAGLDEQRDRIVGLCKKCGAREVRLARDRRNAQAVEVSQASVRRDWRLSPSYCTQDASCRDEAAAICGRSRITAIRIRIVNVFHAATEISIRSCSLTSAIRASPRVLAASNRLLTSAWRAAGA